MIQEITTFSKRILLVVTGVSPQVATETLYALRVPKNNDPLFIPTEMHLITTQKGAEDAVNHLIVNEQFKKLLSDYPELKDVKFDESHIHVIKDDEGRPLWDIQTEEENTQAANTIAALMHDMTSESESALHVSISGGRKTMGFYVGYAFSLYARKQDKLSHVLVSPVEFEHHPDFFFPPAKSKILHDKNGKEIDTRKAKVSLAYIPVVQLRHGLPMSLQEGRLSYGEAVNVIQRTFAPPSLVIRLRKKEVFCDGQRVSLDGALLAWFAWWAQLAKENRAVQSRHTFTADDGLRDLYLMIYKKIALEGYSERSNERLKGSFDEGYGDMFMQNNSKLNRMLEGQLDRCVFARYKIISVNHKKGLRQLDIPSESIELDLD